MIEKQRGIASEIVLDIVNIMEKIDKNEYVYVEQSFWGYPYDHHLYICVFNNLTKKSTRVIEYVKVKDKEGWGVLHILKDMGGDYAKISKHYGKMYDYRNDCWVVEKEKEKYGLRYKKDLLPDCYFEDEVKAKIICDFLNKEGIKQLRR